MSARPKSKRSPAKATATRQRDKVDADAVVAWLKRTGTKAGRDGMARYAIPSDKAFGVSVGALREKAKEIGPDHELALALWESGWYEARMLATFVDEPERVTPAQMERWCREFDNWAIVDTACFALFDRTPHAWPKVAAWASKKGEWVKRAAFALIWSLTVHDRQSGDAPFLRALLLIERGAADERHFVSKAVNMSLRAVGKRNAALNGAAIATAKRLSESSNAAAKWVGKDALRELTSPGVARRLSEM